MLILTRRIGESLIIGDDVRVAILEVKGSQVRVGVAAPANVSVHREEIYEKIKNERAPHPVPEKKPKAVNGNQ